MATIRTKLTVAYAGALLGSVVVFSVALYAARRASARQEVARSVVVQADLAIQGFQLGRLRRGDAAPCRYDCDRREEQYEAPQTADP